MSTWDNDLDRAKQAIKNGDYTRARTILEMMPDNYIARDWLKKLNRMENQYQSPMDNYKSKNSPQQQVIINQNFNLNQGLFSDIPSIPLSIIIGNMALWSCGLVSVVVASPQTAAFTPFVILGLLFLAVVNIVIYYIYWKFFWWMIAITWTASTLWLIFAISAGFNILNNIAYGLR